MNLHKKVIILVTLVLATILSLYSYFIISTMKSQVLNHMENSAKILADSLERSIVTSGAMENPELLQKLVMDFNKVEDIHEVYVINRDFKIIAHPDPDKIGKTYNHEDVRDAIKEGKTETEFKEEEDGEELFDVVIPLVISSKISGAIEVELEFKKVREMIYSATEKAVLSIIFTIIILSLVLITILFSIIVKPLENLVQAANQVAAGSFQPLSNPRSDDEIGQLTRAFNEMILSLQKLSEKDKSANPLTGLPGNIVIKEELDKRLNNKETFSVLYADLDQFKAFNDTYGFEHGDEAIKYTAEKIVQATAEKGGPGDFVGHIGGDDFVVITGLEKGEAVAQRIIELFNENVHSLYAEKQTPLMSISIAHIKVPRGRVKNSLELGELAAELKRKVKSLNGSNYLTEYSEEI